MYVLETMIYYLLPVRVCSIHNNNTRCIYSAYNKLHVKGYRRRVFRISYVHSEHHNIFFQPIGE